MTLKDIFARDRCWMGIITLLALSIFFMNEEPDTWWSLRAGQDVLAGHNIFVERWTWSRPGAYWPNHEVGWEVTFYLLYLLGGKTLILPMLFTSVCMISPVLFSLTKNSKGALKDSSTALFSGLVYFSIFCPLFYYYSQLRAFTFSILAFSVLLWFLRNNYHKYVPLLMLVWANFHGGFIYGCVTIFIAFLLRAVFYLRNKNEDNLTQVKKLLLVGVFSFFATLVNPLGWKLWKYIIESLSKPNAAIVEWAPLKDYPALSFIVLVACVMIVTSLLIGKVDTDWENVFSIVIFFFSVLMTVMVSRNFVYLTVSILPVVNLLFANHLVPRKKQSKFIKIGITSLVLVVLSSSVLLLFSGVKSNSSPISEEAVAAFNDCEGKQWNDYSSGGTLIWFAPERKVYQDNRYDYFDELMVENMLLYDDMNWKLYFDDIEVDCAFILKSEPSYLVVNNDKTGLWVKVFDDGKYAQFKRATLVSKGLQNSESCNYSCQLLY